MMLNTRKDHLFPLKKKDHLFKEKKLSQGPIDKKILLVRTTCV